MNPALPSKIDDELEALCWQVATESADLGKGLPQGLLDSLTEFLEIVNSFYTNSMEGNPSLLKDIEAALLGKTTGDKIQRNYQLEHVAHIKVQREMLKRVKNEKDLQVCGADFITWLHREFYEKVPDEMRFALTQSGKKVPIIPGEIRNEPVIVGKHEGGPETKIEILDYLKLFESTYDSAKLPQKMWLIALAASHHRLLWMHPFSDGNGRVSRLFTVAYMNKIDVASNNIWTINRYFARNRVTYDAHLEMADRPPRNSLDGRGPLSQEDLVVFCKFFLNGCLDQIRYMKETLSLNKFLKPKFEIFLNMKIATHALSKSGALVLKTVLVQGEVPRGDVKDICNVESRRATAIIRELISGGFASSNTAYGPLKIKITSEMASFLFPGLAGA